MYGCTVFGLDGDYLDVGVVFFKPFGDAHERACGAYSSDEMGYSALRVSPDFLGCCFVMRQHVGLVGELVGHEVVVWALAGYFSCQVFCAVHALVCLA